MESLATPDSLHQRNRRLGRLLIGWILGLAVASFLVGWLR